MTFSKTSITHAIALLVTLLTAVGAVVASPTADTVIPAVGVAVSVATARCGRPEGHQGRLRARHGEC